MKHTIKTYSLCLCAGFILGGCSTDNDPLSKPDDMDVQLSAFIESTAYTRMQTGQTGNMAFQKTDRISLRITAPDNLDAPASTHTLELTDQGWMPAMKWQDLSGNSCRFIAFYPTLPDQTAESYVHTVATNQQEMEHYGQSDLLTAVATVQRGEAVRLHFKHLMSLLEVKLTSTQTFTPQQLEQAIVQVHIAPSISVDTSRGNLGAVGTKVQDITFGGGENGTFRAIVPPQPIQESWRKEWITIQIENETFVYAAPRSLKDGTDFQALLSGKHLVLNLKLEKDTAVEDFVNQTVWTYGLQDMPDLKEWGYVDAGYIGITAYPMAGLKWDQKYGWYDCNKTNPTVGSGGDSEMCWAAASANMLYWWLRQNKTYVERFGYQGPSKYNSGTDCAIFAHYKKHFPNKGRNVYEALDWFLTGREVTAEERQTAAIGKNREPMISDVAISTEKENGYFSEVLGEKKKIAKFQSTSDATITEVLKKAFRNREAIECNLLYPSGYLHAINIWGAKFDEQGEVTHIYITDNNDSDYEKQLEEFDFLGRKKTQAGILEKAVQHKNGQTYMESSGPGDFSMQIIQICTLRLMQQEWEAYFATHP